MNSLRIGRGYQIVGVLLIVLGLVLLGYLPTRPRGVPSHVSCRNNLSQIGLSFRTWAIDNDGRFPFNVSTNTGGTMEFCARGSDGFDTNAALHFQVMSNELSTPLLLVCPNDRLRKPAPGFHNLQANNVSYRLYSGTNINESNPAAMLLLCPFDGNAVLCDGSVTAGKTDWKSPRMALKEVVRDNYLDWISEICRGFMPIGVVLLWVGNRETWKAKGGPKPRGLIMGEALLVIVALLFIVMQLVGMVCF